MYQVGETIIDGAENVEIAHDKAVREIIDVIHRCKAAARLDMSCCVLYLGREQKAALKYFGERLAFYQIPSNTQERFYGLPVFWVEADRHLHLAES